tara:strand:- start:7708 stop:8454 length:747 start_codon:yes stop_codon:yes gene_type:complete
MKKIVLIVVVAVCSLQISFSQKINQTTLSKIKVKLLGAENLYEQGKYYETLEKIREIEAISEGMKSAKIQNLKVKAYLGWGLFQSSKDELDKLYEMNPDDAIIKDIASYESKIDEGIEEEKLAEIKKEEKRLKTEEAYKYFKYKECPRCDGYGTEEYYKKVKCTSKNYNLAHCDNGTWVFTNMYGTRRSTHEFCDGTGREEKEFERSCGNCKGTGKTLQYTGSYYFTSSEIENILRNNRSKIIEYLNK